MHKTVVVFVAIVLLSFASAYPLSECEKTIKGECAELSWQFVSTGAGKPVIF